MDEMTREEMDLYRFRVGRLHFQDPADAIRFAERDRNATRVEFRWPDGTWREFWTDGDIEYTRPGFGVLKPYRVAA